MGVSHRRLCGWEPAEVTLFEYDGDVLVRSVTVREAEFTDDEVSLLLASRRVAASIGPHGVSMSEATDPSNRGKFIVNESPRVDYARLAIDKAREKHYTENPKAKDDQSAHIWYIKGRDGDS